MKLYIYIAESTTCNAAPKDRSICLQAKLRDNFCSLKEKHIEFDFDRRLNLREVYLFSTVCESDIVT